MNEERFPRNETGPYDLMSTMGPIPMPEQSMVWLGAIFEGSRDGIFISDSDSCFVAVNGAACKLTGYSRSELLRMRIPDLHDAADLEAYYRHHKPIMEGQELLTEAWLRRKDGSKIYVEFSNRKMTFADRTYLHAVARDITIWRQAHEDLRGAKEYAEEVIEAAGVLVLELDGQGRIESINEVAGEVLGLYKAEIIGQGFADAVLPGARNSKAREIFERWRSERGGDTGKLEGLLVTCTGEERYTTWTLSRITAAENGDRIVCLGIDLTDRLRMEEALKQSEERYRKMVEWSPLGIVIYSEGRFEYINPAALRMGGAKSAEELIGKPVLDYIHPDYRDFAVKRLKQMMETGETTMPAEVKLARRDGSYYDADIVSSPLVYEGKSAVQSILRDISESKQAQAQLRKVIYAVEQSSSAVVIADERGTVEYANRRFTDITGFSQDEVIGEGIPSLFCRSDPDTWEHSCKDAILSGRKWSRECKNARKDGTAYWAHLNLSPVRNDEGKVTNFILTFDDVTERRGMEEKLHASQRLEALGTLAGGVAHDFNNLLTVINGYSEMILDELPEGDPIRRDLDEIRKAGHKAALLTGQLLAFSRKQVVMPRLLDLNDLIRETDKMLRRLIREDIELVLEMDPRLGRVRMDPGQMTQVIINLVVNARDAMPQGGRLAIRTKCFILTQESVRWDGRLPAGEYGLLEIADTGCGMDEETVKHIFEPFYTTKEAGKGTGLGLSTVYGIIGQNGGYIEMMSEVGKGTTARVYLPIASEAAADTEQSPDSTAVRSGNETILLAEDDVNIRSLCTRVLERHGYNTLLAVDGEQALEIGRTHEGPIHLLISDLVMPRMSGRELARRLFLIRPGIKLMYISGYSDEAVLRPQDHDKDALLLLKPFGPDLFSSRVREILDRRA